MLEAYDKINSLNEQLEFFYGSKVHDHYAEKFHLQFDQYFAEIDENWKLFANYNEQTRAFIDKKSQTDELLWKTYNIIDHHEFWTEFRQNHKRLVDCYEIFRAKITTFVCRLENGAQHSSSYTLLGSSLYRLALKFDDLFRRQEENHDHLRVLFERTEQTSNFENVTTSLSLNVEIASTKSEIADSSQIKSSIYSSRNTINSTQYAESQKNTKHSPVIGSSTHSSLTNHHGISRALSTEIIFN